MNPFIEILDHWFDFHMKCLVTMYYTPYLIAGAIA